MTTFSSLFQSGTAFYGDPFGPIIDVIQDFGWSLLPQFPGSILAPKGGGGHVGLPPVPTVTHPQVPVAQDPGGWRIEAETTHVPPILARPVGTGGAVVRRETVVVEGVSTEVERHPEGDFPAGSIFAPGQAWEPVYDSYGGEPEVGLDIGGIIDWGLTTLSGQQPWQAQSSLGFGPGVTPVFAAGTSMVPVPSGIPGQPTTITGYTGGRAVTNGDNCGNRRYVTLDRETGKITCKRRRRRRLLTNRDLADLASLKTVVGGGAALNSAVIRAVR